MYDTWGCQPRHMSTKRKALRRTLHTGTAGLGREMHRAREGGIGREMAAFRHAYVAFEYKSCTQHGLAASQTTPESDNSQGPTPQCLRLGDAQ